MRKAYSPVSGQALVLVLLSLAVVLTLVLYVLSRTVTDIAISTRDEEAVRSFSAAEAGIERALVVGSSTGNISVGDANFSANISSFAEGSRRFTFPVNFAAGDSGTLWFVSHDPNGNLTCGAGNPCFSGSQLKVCWGKPGTAASSATTPAVEVGIFYAVTPGNYKTLRIGRGAFDPNSSRRDNNLFAAPDPGTCVIGTESFEFQKRVGFSDLGIPAGSYGADNGLQFAKVTMLYNTDQSYQIGLDVTGDTLPSQGFLVNSTGSSGESNRRLEAFQAYSESSPVFDDILFDSSGFTQ